MSVNPTKNWTRVFLWSTRRVLSTPLQRAIFQLEANGINQIVQHCEPFALNFYMGKDRRSKQFTEEEAIEAAKNWDSIPTIADSLEVINNYKPSQIASTNDEKSNFLFIKEHAIYVWPNIIPDKMLIDSKNTFIIRNPTKAIKSYWRQVLTPEDSMWTHIVPDECGFKELYFLFDYISNNLNQDTFIIDADDLISQPSKILKNYCDFSGLTYDDCMLDWKNDKNYNKGEKPWDFIPPSWISDVNSTDGFRTKDKQHDPNIEYPQMVFDIIKECEPYYEKLYQQRFVP